MTSSIAPIRWPSPPGTRRPPSRSPLVSAASALGMVIHAIFSALLLLGLALLLGHTMLDGRLQGGDSALHVAYAAWLDAYFPHIPHWYPLQGSGESLLHGYPIFSHLIVVLVHRITGLSILQAFRAVSFSSFPLAAYGLYLLGWSLWKRQTPGLIAATLYLLAPVTWTWMYDWGFLAQQVGSVFLPLALLAYDRTFACQMDIRRSGSGRLWFAALTVLVLLSFLSHMLVAVAAVSGMALHGLASAWISRHGNRGRTLRGVVKILLLLGITVGLLAAAYIVPFYAYGQVANREGLNTPAPHQLHRLPILPYFGLEAIDPANILTRMQFPAIVSLAAALGLALAFLLASRGSAHGRAALCWGLVLIPATIFVLSPELVALVLKSSWLAVMFVNFRSLLILVMALQPLLAGYGMWALARLILVPEEAFGGEPRPRWAGLGMRQGLAGPLALAFALAAILPVSRLTASDPWRRSYGPRALDLRDIWGLALDDSCDLPSSAPGRPPLCNSLEARSALHLGEFGQACDLMEARGETLPSLCSSAEATAAEVASFLQECDASSDSSAACQARVHSLARQLLAGPWPALQLSDQDPDIQASRDLVAELPPGRPLRMDVSPHLGRFAQDLGFYADASQLDSYTFQINLIHEMWGDQQNVFYSREEGVDERGTPSYLNDLAWWFGISTVVLHADLDPLETYAAAGWNLRSQVGDAEVWEWGGAPPMATLTSRPVVLVIGTPVNDAYMTVFRLAGGGMLPIDEALLVEGRPRIDDYTPEELRPFDAIILYGYDYSNRANAWQTIETYAAEGGSVFLDTGWEYAIPEWEFDPAPAFFPITRASWTGYGLPAEYALGDPSIGGDIDVNLFKPLEWEGAPWSVSGAEASDLRPGATTVLSAAGRPLVAAWRYGQGRVVWSGMNLIAHALYRGENDEEIRFLHNLLSWLLAGHEGDDGPAPSVLREDPDRVDVLLSPTASQTSWLLWREAYYPRWRAELTDAGGIRTAPIYRAGPGLMLIPINTDSPSALLALTWEASWVERLAVFASIAGLGLLGALVMDGLLLGGEGFTRLRIAIQTQSPRPFLGEGAGVDWMEERKKEIAERRAARRRRGAPDEAQGPKTAPQGTATTNEREASREPGARPPEGGPR